MTVTRFPNGVGDGSVVQGRLGLAMLGVGHANFLDDFHELATIDFDAGTGDSTLAFTQRWDVTPASDGDGQFGLTSTLGPDGWLLIGSGEAAGANTNMLLGDGSALCVGCGSGKKWAIAFRINVPNFGLPHEHFIGLLGDGFAYSSGVLNFGAMIGVGIHSQSSGDSEWELILFNNSATPQQGVPLNFDLTDDEVHDCILYHDGGDTYQMWVDDQLASELVDSDLDLAGTLGTLGASAGNNNTASVTPIPYALDYFGVSAERQSR